MSEVLLVRRARMPFKDFWSLPGGRMEPGETARETAIRELREETGLHANALQFVTTFIPQHQDARYGQFRISVFACTGFSGRPRAGDDARELRWQALDQLHNARITPGTEWAVASAHALINTRN